MIVFALCVKRLGQRAADARSAASNENGVAGYVHGDLSSWG
jgi:hypothetical protein